MSEENVEIVRRATDAVNRRDRAGWLALHDQNYEMVPSRDFPQAETVRGRERVWDFYIDLYFESFDWDSGNPEIEITDAGGDKVFVHVRVMMRGQASGAEVEASTWMVFTLQSGMILRGQYFQERAEALEAAGLSE